VLGDVQKRWTTWRTRRKAKKLDLYATTEELRFHMTPREAYAWWCFLWARKDAHLEQYAADMRRKFPNQRDALYRAEAIRIATEYASVTIDSYKIDELKKLDPITLPGEGVRDMAQSQLQDAAPGRFREILLDVMGPRCTPCKRPGMEEKTAPVRGKKSKQATRAATASSISPVVGAVEGTL
jgi:hypothetical protein